MRSDHPPCFETYQSLCISRLSNKNKNRIPIIDNNEHHFCPIIQVIAPAYYLLQELILVLFDPFFSQQMYVTLVEMVSFGLGELLLLFHSGGVLYLGFVPKSLLDNMQLMPPRNSQKWCVVRISLLYWNTTVIVILEVPVLLILVSTVTIYLEMFVMIVISSWFAFFNQSNCDTCPFYTHFRRRPSLKRRLKLRHIIERQRMMDSLFADRIRW